MNKAELTDAVQSQLGEMATKKQAAEAINAVLNSIAEGLKTAGKVQLVGFGTFSSKVRAARKGRNPRTGEAITIPEATVISFKASKDI